jgi:hypothetical protein
MPSPGSSLVMKYKCWIEHPPEEVLVLTDTETGEVVGEIVPDPVQ